MIIYGINPVLEALRAGRVKELRVADRADGRLRRGDRSSPANAACRARRVPATTLERDARRGVHQGVVADVEEAENYSVEELVRGAAGPPLLVVSTASRIRTTSAPSSGRPMRPASTASSARAGGAASLDGAAAKASAGAVAHVRIAEVVNIARAVEELKEAGVWTVGLDGECRHVVRRR